MIDIYSIKSKRVILKVDFSYATRFPAKIEQVLPTLNLLLNNGCGVCIITSLGAALLPPTESSRPIVEILSRYLKMPVKWLPGFKGANILLGQVYLSENTFMTKREIESDPVFINEMVSIADVVVFDTLKYLDANYASTQGIIATGIAKSLGLTLIKLETLAVDIKQSKIGLIAGGQRTAWQLRFIRSMVKNLSFLVVGGELAKVFAGKGHLRNGMLHDEVIRTLAILRKEKVKVLYPVDVVAYSTESQRNRVCLYQDLDTEEIVYDLAIQSRTRIIKHLNDSDVNMVVISGTIGNVFDPRYARSSEILLKELVKYPQKKVIVGKSALVTASRLSILAGYQYLLEGSTLEMSYLTEGSSLESQIFKHKLKENIGVADEV